QRGGNAWPEVGTNGEITLIAEQFDRAPPVPRLAQPFDGALQRRRESRVSLVAVRHEGRVAPAGPRHGQIPTDRRIDAARERGGSTDRCEPALRRVAQIIMGMAFPSAPQRWRSAAFSK